MPAHPEVERLIVNTLATAEAKGLSKPADIATCIQVVLDDAGLTVVRRRLTARRGPLHTCDHVGHTGPCPACGERSL